MGVRHYESGQKVDYQFTSIHTKLEPIYEENKFGDFNIFYFTVPAHKRIKITNIQLTRDTPGDMTLSISDGNFTIEIAKIASETDLYYEPSNEYWIPAGWRIVAICETTGANDNENLYVLYEQEIEY